MSINNIYYFHPSGLKPHPLEEMDWFMNAPSPIPFKKVFNMVKNGVLEGKNEPVREIAVLIEKEIEKVPFLKETIAATDEINGYEYVRNLSLDILIFYEWGKYKQIYRFDNTLFEVLTEETMSGDIPVRILLDRLPFNAFFIDNPIKDQKGNEFRGVYVVKVESRNGPQLLLYFVMSTEERDFCFCYVPLALGEKPLDTLIQDVNSLNDIDKHTYEEYTQGMESQRYLAKKALNLLVYLCSEEQDTEKVVIRVPKGKKKETKVRKTYVGKKLGRTIYETKKRYVYDEKGAIGLGKGTPKAPHLRKAHYHSFWTGKKDKPEERKLVVKFVAPTYINGEERENIETTTRKIK